MKKFGVVVAAALSAMSLGIATSASTASAAPAHAVVVSVKATPHVLGSVGGTVQIKAVVKHATKCSLKVLAAKSLGIGYSHNAKSCSSGSFSAHIVITANRGVANKILEFSVVARNKNSSGTGKFYVTVVGGGFGVGQHHTVPPTTTATTVAGATNSGTTTTTAPVSVGGGAPPTTSATTTPTTAPTTTVTTVPSSFTCPAPETIPGSAPGSGITFAQAVDADTCNNSGAVTTAQATVTPKTAGDLVILAIGTYGLQVTSVTGGGVSWQPAPAVRNPASGLDAAGFDNGLWIGTVTSGVGTPQTLTVDFSSGSGVTKSIAELSYSEFSPGTGATWDTTPLTENMSSTSDSPTVTFPPLNNVSTSALYFGYSIPGSPSGVTLTPGASYTERLTAAGGVTVYDASYTSSVTAPTYDQSPASDANSVAIAIGVTS